MARISVVLNPVSGRGEGRRRKRELESLLSERTSDWEIVETTATGSGIELAKEAVERGAEVVAAAGGDGTLNEVLNGVYGTGAALGLIPMGTGNDFARHLGIQGDFRAAVRNLFEGRRLAVDLGLAQGRRFLNVSGCGFDAAVAERINEGFRFLRGTPAYLAAVVGTLARFQPIPMRIALDGSPESAHAMLCSIANASSYGGGMKIAPNADVTDGLFDVCILHALGKAEFLRSFGKVFKGTHTDHPKVSIRRAKSIRIETDRPIPVLIDGEIRGMTPVEFTMLPASVEFLVPG